MHPRGDRRTYARNGHWEWTLSHEDRSVGNARRLVAGEVAELDREVVEVTLLLTSEVVTNALRFGAGDTLHLLLDLRDDRLRVEVEDRVTGPTRLPLPRQLDDRGLGLMLLDALATRWGATSGPGSKLVWFTLQLTKAPAERAGESTPNGIRDVLESARRRVR
jgi:hypothetical protein